jgi:hypothetical protein
MVIKNNDNKNDEKKNSNQDIEDEGMDQNSQKSLIESPMIINIECQVNFNDENT